MRILYSCPLDISKDSAPRQHVLGVVRGLVKQGHIVDLIYPGFPSVFPKLEGLSITGVYPTAGKFRRDWGLGQTIIHTINQHSFEVVYHRFTKSSFFPAVLSRVLGKPLVLELNSDLRSDLRHYWRHFSLKFKLAELVQWVNCLSANHIICVSHGIARYVSKLPCVSSSKITVIPNGVDLEVYKPLDSMKSRKKLSLRQNHYYVAFVGTFQAWQGLRTIVEAADLLREHQPPISFLMVGDGPEKSSIQELVRRLSLEAHFHFTGWCAPGKASLYIGASDICLAPYTRSSIINPSLSVTKGSLMKGSPLKIYSYLAAGRPVIASHFAGAGQLVEDIGAGMAIEPDSPFALAEAIKEILADEARRLRLAKRARFIAENRLGWELVAQQVINICEQAVTK